MNAALGRQECCYDGNKKVRLKELKMTHGAYVKRENAVITRNVFNNGNVYLSLVYTYDASISINTSKSARNLRVSRRDASISTSARK